MSEKKKSKKKFEYKVINSQDRKVKGYIDEKMVKQVLAYHYMSTKRSDLDIKNLIIFDALSQNFVKLNVA